MPHQIPKLKCFSSRLALVFVQPQSEVLSQEWRYSWSSAVRRYSNYILVINKFIAHPSATYIRRLTIYIIKKTDHDITKPHTIVVHA